MQKEFGSAGRPEHQDGQHCGALRVGEGRPGVAGLPQEQARAGRRCAYPLGWDRAETLQRWQESQQTGSRGHACPRPESNEGLLRGALKVYERKRKGGKPSSQ